MAASGVKTKKRALWLLAFFGVLFFALFLRIGYLMIIKAPWLQQKAQSQWTSDLVIKPLRGEILDRNMQVIAQSGSVDTVVVRPEQVKDAEALADAVSTVLGIDRDTVLTKALDKTKGEIILKRQITKEQSARLREMNIPGIAFTVESKRYYPLGNFLAQTIGFTSIDGVGQEGIELAYEKYLKGVEGRIVEETDRKGNEIPFGEQFIVPAEQGNDVVLTIDYVIQSFLEEALTQALEINNAKSVMGIALDPKTGEILAIGQMPDYDPNNPPRNDPEAFARLTRNSVIVDSNEPGSTFKIVTLAAALESGVANLHSGFYCPGHKNVNSDIIKCWKRSPGHGSQSLTEAVMNSCNVAFMQMGLSLGTDRFYDYIYAFGFGDVTGIDYIGESKGIVIHRKYVRDQNIARIAFGQSISVTPLQLATATAAAINGGNLMKPTLVKKILNSEGEVILENKPTLIRKVISAQTSETVRQILESVVKEGTGKNAYIPGYRVGGKTGTAQKYDENKKVAVGKNISSFIGFAPADDPQILVLLMVDEPNVGSTYGSIVAAPHVRNVLESSLKYLGVEPVYAEGEEAVAKNLVTVPDITGMSAQEAATTLSQVGLSGIPNGTGKVVSQMPAANEKTYAGTQVLLYMSEPEADPEDDNRLTVPDLYGMTILEATEACADAGFILKPNGTGKAFYQSPKAGELLEIGGEIRADFR